MKLGHAPDEAMATRTTIAHFISRFVLIYLHWASNDEHCSLAVDGAGRLIKNKFAKSRIRGRKSDTVIWLNFVDVIELNVNKDDYCRTYLNFF